MSKQEVYDIYSDPGHAWIKVTIAELERLGIEKNISPYSYILGDYAFLEEDCDFATFVDAKKAAGEELTAVNFNTLPVEHQENHPPYIRNMKRYNSYPNS